MSKTVEVTAGGVVASAKTEGDKKLRELHRQEDAFGLFVVVEGNIGSGKSEFCHMLRRIREEYDGPAEVLLEPVGKPRFRRLLGAYYEDMARWGFAFQMHALNERFRQHTYAAELASRGKHVVQDRSIYADGCFGTVVFEDGNMTEDEFAIYADCFGNMKRFLRYPDVLVYLRTDPQVCYDRMSRRARAEESAVPLEYLRRIHDKHELFVEEMSRFTRVLRVDWSHFGADIEAINRQINAVAEEDRRFIRDFRRL